MARGEVSVGALLVLELEGAFARDHAFVGFVVISPSIAHVVLKDGEEPGFEFGGRVAAELGEGALSLDARFLDDIRGRLLQLQLGIGELVGFGPESMPIELEKLSEFIGITGFGILEEFLPCGFTNLLCGCHRTHLAREQNRDVQILGGSELRLSECV